MTITVVTSCSGKGWHDYGKRFVQTFDKLWPVEINLCVVSEDQLEHVYSQCERQIKYSWLWHNQAAKEFDLRHRFVARPNGRAKEHTANKNGAYNFRFDAYKFAKKVFAIETVAKELKKGGGLLFWIDADALTHNQVPADFCFKMLPAGFLLSCLARGEGYHSECGFVGYNLMYENTLEFIRRFAALYATDEVFKLKEWHDSFVFDWLRQQMAIPTYHIPHRSKSHPFVNSELGLYMDHLKGARKQKGRTPIAEIKYDQQRKVPYWQKGMA